MDRLEKVVVPSSYPLFCRSSYRRYATIGSVTHYVASVLSYAFHHMWQILANDLRDNVIYVLLANDLRDNVIYVFLE
jgi:hypothetical protein